MANQQPEAAGTPTDVQQPKKSKVHSGVSTNGDVQAGIETVENFPPEEQLLAKQKQLRSNDEIVLMQTLYQLFETVNGASLATIILWPSQHRELAVDTLPASGETGQ